MEFQNLGYFIYRSTDPVGTGQIIGEFIAAEGSAHAYEFQDRSATPGMTFYYWLEDIDWNLNRTQHGPVEVTP